MVLSQTNQSEIEEAITHLKAAVAAKKCWSCGCFHNSLTAIENAISPIQRTSELDTVIKAGRKQLATKKYDCLECDVCYAALAINSMESSHSGCNGELEVCPNNQVEERKGWPPLPGAFTVLRYQASVAICTLTDEALATSVAHNAIPAVAIVGTVQTENLGIERLILNILANPNIRFLILCGADSQQAVGHLPGQSLLAMANSGIDSKALIIGAKGKRPVLRNIAREAIDHFRRNVEVIDLIGNTQLPEIINIVEACSGRNPGKAEPYSLAWLLKPLTGYLLQHMVPDPAGYFVIYVDKAHGILSLEHYQSDGSLDAVIEGKTPSELYIPAVDRGLVTRLDHAAYLGRELARAEQSLLSGNPYVQDAAPEHKVDIDNSPSCTCESSYKQVKS